MLLALAVSLVVADLPPPQKPVSITGCARNSDCRLSQFEGCCTRSCCPPPPHAEPKSMNEAIRCGLVDCAMVEPVCSEQKCARVELSEWVAVCEEGECVARHRPPRPPPPPLPQECRVDDDCQVVEQPAPASAACQRSSCGCCSVTRAMPKSATVRIPVNEGARPPRNGPSFGLSTGSPPAAGCPACTRAGEQRAVCSAGSCTLRPRGGGIR